MQKTNISTLKFLKDDQIPPPPP